VEIVSLGGATEASIWSICYRVERVEKNWRSIPYGKPLRNQKFEVLNQRMERCPDWVPGELYIGGMGLARGYWREEKRTAEQFVVHPESGERVYRTGDWGRYWPDGTIEFLGREDSQVKLHGHRVELGEIEAVLKEHPAIEDAVVLTSRSTSDHKQLVAYVIRRLSEGSRGRSSKTSETSEPAYDPQCAPGVIDETAERTEFVIKQSAIIDFPPGLTDIQLERPKANESLSKLYHARRTRRDFQPDIVLLENFNQLLSSLFRASLDGYAVPKARYPSAGSLYPVQTYLHVKPNRVAGIDGGVYYYHPFDHRLALRNKTASIEANVHTRNNRSAFERCAFAIFLIGDLDAIAPLYGAFAKDFCLLEAGAMVQLLMTEAPASDLGFCPIGHLDFESLKATFGLMDSQILLHSLVGGKIASTSEARSSARPESNGVAEDLPVEIRNFLHDRLPAYMVPSKFVQMAQFPLNSNGKIDRRALQAVKVPPPAPLALSLPETEMERLVMTLFQEIVGVQTVAASENFFSAGADSLHLVRLQRRLEEKLGRQIPTIELFRHSTVTALARYLCAEQRPSSADEGLHDRARKQKEMLGRLRRKKSGSGECYE